MNLMKNIYIALFAAVILSSAGLSAQNLDPTVVVDRAYEGKLMEVHKPYMDMAVPDTLVKFDLDFDYSVFETPYRRSYEFNPYLISMRPDASYDRSRNFYLKAGAGYSLHPLLDMVWSPELKGNLSLDVYAAHDSYVGKYHNLHEIAASEPVWSGHDLKSVAGVSGRYDWNKALLRFGAGYYGLAVKDKNWRRSYNAMDIHLSSSSKATWEGRFIYDVAADYRYAQDKMKGVSQDHEKMGEHVFVFGSSFGTTLRGSHRFLFGLGFDISSCSGGLKADAAQLYFLPRYEYRRGSLRVEAGLRFSKIVDSEHDARSRSVAQILYPDINVEYAVIPANLKLYAAVEGGNEVNTYSALLDRNHHVGLYSGMGPLMDYTVVPVALKAGLEGSVRSRLSYNVAVGYVDYANAPLDAVLPMADDIIGFCNPALGYDSYQKWYASLGVRWNSESLMFDGSVSYNGCWGNAFEEGSYFLMPSAVDSYVAFEYNWNRRIMAGVDCEFASARKGYIYTVPWYADLGVSAEYAFNKKFSLWLRAGNLLGMNIQRNPVYAEKGVYFTAGICLVL